MREHRHEEELAVRSARKDGRELVRLRCTEDEGGVVVECELYPVDGFRVQPLRPGPYRFGTRADAETFVRETVTIVEHLGCEVT